MTSSSNIQFLLNIGRRRSIKRFSPISILQYVEATADELETKDGLLSGCGGGGNADPSTTMVGRAQQFYSVLMSSLEENI